MINSRLFFSSGVKIALSLPCAGHHCVPLATSPPATSATAEARDPPELNVSRLDEHIFLFKSFLFILYPRSATEVYGPPLQSLACRGKV